MSSPLRRAVSVPAVALAIALVTVSCGGGAALSDGAASTSSTSTTVAERPPDPEYRSWVATVKDAVSLIEVLDRPAGEPLLLDMDQSGTPAPVILGNRNENDVPMTFLVKEQFVEAGDVVWHQVYLPVRPNESTGWVKAADVELTYTDMALTLSLGAKILVVHTEGAEVSSFPVAIGEPATPTPTGFFYVKELLAPIDPDGAYGPLAYGLSGHSDEVDNLQFPDGVIGIHGTNQPELIGGEVSQGCVRMRNEDIVALAALEVPLGTPVTITA